MNAPEKMSALIDRKRYSTKTAELVAGDDYWDGHNFERRGRNRFLYRTTKGNYFVLYLTQWEREQDHIEPVSLDEVIRLYETELSEHSVEYDEAFPGVEVQEA